MKIDFSQKINYQIKENKPMIEAFIQKHHKTIVKNEYEYQKKLHEQHNLKFSKNHFCQEHLGGVSKNTFFAWRDRNNITLKKPAFEVISETETFKKTYENYLYTKLTETDPEEKKAEEIKTIIITNKLDLQIVYDSIQYTEKQLEKGKISKSESQYTFVAHLYDLCENKLTHYLTTQQPPDAIRRTPHG